MQESNILKTLKKGSITVSGTYCVGPAF